MIGVVMPTLWKGEHYKKMLPILDSHPLISEIFIIDNNSLETDHQTLNKIKKLTYYKPSENLYVNPSWNYGVKHCNTDQICLYSDDVLFDIECLVDVFNYMTPKNGVIGFSQNSIFSDLKSVYFSEWESKQIVQTNDMHYRFGICMFMHKSSYYKIPDEFKIYFGDTFLFENNIKENKMNFVIDNYYAVTPMSVSSKSIEFQSIIEAEKNEYKSCYQ